MWIENFDIGDRKYRIDSGGFAYRLPNEEVAIQHELNKLAIWSFRHLDSILKYEAEAESDKNGDVEQEFENLKLKDSRLFELRYQSGRDIVFYSPISSKRLDTKGGGAQPDDSARELFAIHFNSMSARKTSHPLLHPEIELKRQEIIWAYQAERDGQQVWCNTSVEEAWQLEKLRRQVSKSKGCVYGVQFKFDSTLCDGLLNERLDQPIFECKVAYCPGKDCVTLQNSRDTMRSKTVFRFSWDAVQGDIIYQCSQWMYSLEAHFRSNQESYCYTLPTPSQMVESIWSSLACIHHSHHVHLGCKRQCDPRRHYNSFQNDLFCKLSPAVLCVARIGLSQLQGLLNGNSAEQHVDHFDCKKWNCKECYPPPPPKHCIMILQTMTMIKFVFRMGCRRLLKL